MKRGQVDITGTKKQSLASRTSWYLGTLLMTGKAETEADLSKTTHLPIMCHMMR